MSEPDTRKIRPWVAALLTFLGWGVGLYYARRKGAVALAAFQVLVGLTAAFGLVLLLRQGPADLGGWINPEGLAYTDALNLGLSALVAIIVWRLAAQRQAVARSGPARLFGYIAIWLGPIMAALMLAMLLRFFAYQPFRAPSVSMEPTLPVGRHFITEKWAYGYTRYSLAPFERLAPAGRWMGREPSEGDVVVFRAPHEPGRSFVKRIVAGPGARVQMVDGALFINGAAVERENLGEHDFNIGGEIRRARAWRETLPNGARYVTLDLGPGAFLDDTREFIVPEGHYFVMGDHRDHSDDSRHSVGYVPAQNIFGRAVLGQDVKIDPGLSSNAD